MNACQLQVRSVWGGWRGVKRDVGFVRQLENSGGERPKIGGFSEELQFFEDTDNLDQRVNT